jgi:hypothetical protein
MPYGQCTGPGVIRMSCSTFYCLYDTITDPQHICIYVCKDNKIFVTQILSVLLARPRTRCRYQTRKGTQKRVQKTVTKSIFMKRQIKMQQALLYNKGFVVGDYTKCLQKN